MYGPWSQCSSSSAADSRTHPEPAEILSTSENTPGLTHPRNLVWAVPFSRPASWWSGRFKREVALLGPPLPAHGPQLRAISQTEHRKLGVVATHLDEAVRCARARRNPEPSRTTRSTDGRATAARCEPRTLERGETVNATGPGCVARSPPAGDPPVRRRQARPALGSAQRKNPSLTSVRPWPPIVRPHRRPE